MCVTMDTTKYVYFYSSWICDKLYCLEAYYSFGLIKDDR